MMFWVLIYAVLGAATKQRISSKASVEFEKPFQASEWIHEIIDYVKSFDQPRNTEVLDFFSGQANLYRRGCHRGYSCQTYDILLDEEQNILTHVGFYMGLLRCLEVEEGLAYQVGPGVIGTRAFPGVRSTDPW